MQPFLLMHLRFSVFFQKKAIAKRSLLLNIYASNLQGACFKMLHCCRVIDAEYNNRRWFIRQTILEQEIPLEIIIFISLSLCL